MKLKGIIMLDHRIDEAVDFCQRRMNTGTSWSTNLLWRALVHSGIASDMKEARLPMHQEQRGEIIRRLRGDKITL
ncbi:MAG: hypothetical protein MRY49_00790 [Candidatus Pacebacteria bacterium]|nr:hypothetical protein [Candidatus Paceibacterota bacterium]